jgi:hypothetical protein
MFENVGGQECRFSVAVSTGHRSEWSADISSPDDIARFGVIGE